MLHLPAAAPRRVFAASLVLIGVACSGLALASPAAADASPFKTVYTVDECRLAALGGYTCKYSYWDADAGNLTAYGRQRLTDRATAVVNDPVSYGPTTGWGHYKYDPGPTKAGSMFVLADSWRDSDARMDCSGFTRFVYDTLGIDIEWTEGRTKSGTWDSGSQNQPDRFYEVSSSAAKPGDLIWFKSVKHVAIYMGGNDLIESTSAGLDRTRRWSFASSGMYAKSNMKFYRVLKKYVP